MRSFLLTLNQEVNGMTNTLDYEKLRTQIRIRRVRNHWRQADLAERIDVTPA